MIVRDGTSGFCYAEGEVEGWAERVGAHASQQAYSFFNDEDEGTGPRLADRFIGAL